jgi:hypothetical protein
MIIGSVEIIAAPDGEARGPRLSPAIGVSFFPRPCQLRHRVDMERGPVSAPILPDDVVAIVGGPLEALFRANEARIRRGAAEGCLSQKISILISAEGSTVERRRLRR